MAMITNELACDSSPLARMADDRFHQALRSDEGAQLFHDFAAKFSLKEWHQAAKFMGPGTAVSDLTITENGGAIVFHGSQTSINERINRSMRTTTNDSSLIMFGGVLVTVTAAARGLPGKVGPLLGCTMAGIGLCDYLLHLPQSQKALHSLEQIVVRKGDLLR